MNSLLLDEDEAGDFDIQYIKAHKPANPKIIDLKLKIEVNKDRMKDLLLKKSRWLDWPNYKTEYEDLDRQNEIIGYKQTILEREEDIIKLRNQLETLNNKLILGRNSPLLYNSLDKYSLI